MGVANIWKLDHILMVLLITGLYEVYPQTLDCSSNSPKHNHMKLSTPVYDTDDETNYFFGFNSVKDVYSLDNYRYANVTKKSPYNDGIHISISQIDEKNEPFQPITFYYNFTIFLKCYDDVTKPVYTTIPLIDTNNHEPFFDKPKYTYNLISNHAEDFLRQQTLNPIAVTDYDVTNNGILFEIEQNKYFNIKYNGKAQDVFNKKHRALLVPKNPGEAITEVTNVAITATDKGYPPRKSVARLVINPPSPPAPVFSKSLYVSHYYKNHSFVSYDNPELEEGTTYYKTTIAVINISDEVAHPSKTFYAELTDGEVLIKKRPSRSLPEFFEHTYYVYELTASYVDKTTGLSSSGRSIFIVELHHDL